MADPHPAAFTATSSTPAASKAAMFRRAIPRARSSSPAWAWRAPQHPCPGTSTTWNPFTARTLRVASLTRRKSPSWTHPVRIPTRGPMAGAGVGTEVGGDGGGVAGGVDGAAARPTLRAGPDASSMARPKRSRPATPPAGRLRRRRRGSPVARRIRLRAIQGRNRTGRATRARRSRVARSGGLDPRATARARSRRYPYSTPDGQTVSQARHPRHRSRWSWKAGAAGSSRPSATARMRWSRPRGESASSPRRT
jgi:hypothetical protein